MVLAAVEEMHKQILYSGRIWKVSSQESEVFVGSEIILVDFKRTKNASCEYSSQN